MLLKQDYLKFSSVFIWLIFILQIFFILPGVLFAFPNAGLDAGTLPQGIVFVRERWLYTDYTERYDESKKKYVELASDEFYKSTWSLTEIAYGITDKLTLVANIWYFDSEIKSGSDIGNDNGLGDCFFLSKYKMISVENEPFSGLAGLMALRLPTGDEKKEPILRLGDGSTDIGVGFSATKQWGRATNSLLAGYWINMKGDNAVDKRDQIEVRTTTEYEILPKKLNVQMEFKGYWFEGNKERLLELVPGIQYTPIFPLTLQLSYKFPFEARGYFKYDHQIILGVTFGFPLFHKTK